MMTLKDAKWRCSYAASRNGAYPAERDVTWPSQRSLQRVVSFFYGGSCKTRLYSLHNRYPGL